MYRKRKKIAIVLLKKTTIKMRSLKLPDVILKPAAAIYGVSLARAFKRSTAWLLISVAVSLPLLFIRK